MGFVASVRRLEFILRTWEAHGGFQVWLLVGNGDTGEAGKALDWRAELEHIREV